MLICNLLIVIRAELAFLARVANLSFHNYDRVGGYKYLMPACASESRRESWKVNPLRGFTHAKNIPLFTGRI
jgi:hypothetical protein